MKLCTKCVMPDTTPAIKFDKNGICNYCQSYKSPKILGETKLKEILESYKAKNKKYDCMIGLSGGRDSMFTLWKLVHDYNMKVIGINYDSPFASKQAKENIDKAVEILKIDLVKWEYPNNQHFNTTAKALKIWAKHPSSSTIPIVCTHCKSWWPKYFYYARKYDVPLFVIGSNPFETASFKKKGFGGARTYHKLNNIPKLFKNTIKEFSHNPEFLTKFSPIMYIKMFMGASHSNPFMRYIYKDINVVRLFDYIPWNEKEVETTIQENLDWKKSPEVEATWRFDCRLDYVRRLMYYKTIGVTELRDLYSKLIREGQISRDEALARLEKEEKIPIEVANDVLAPFNMKIEDVLGSDFI